MSDIQALIGDLDDPAPPVPGPEHRSTVVGRVRRRQRRHALAGGLAAASLAVAAIAVASTRSAAPRVVEVGGRGTVVHARAVAGGVVLHPTGAADPPVFIASAGMVSPPPGTSDTVLRSATTGAVVTSLPVMDTSRAAPSPSGSVVWFNDYAPLGTIQRLDVRSGATAAIGTGTEPVVSPDGHHLAYLDDHGDVVLLELRTGRSVAVDADAALGSSSGPGAIQWVDDATVALQAPARGVAAVGGGTVTGVGVGTVPGATTTVPPTTTTTASGPATPSCAAASGGRCVVLVQVTTPEVAHVLRLPGAGGVGQLPLAVDGAGRLLADVRMMAGDRIARYVVGPAGARPAGSLPVPGYVADFSPSGTSLIYTTNPDHGVDQRIWRAGLTDTGTSAPQSLGDGYVVGSW